MVLAHAGISSQVIVSGGRFLIGLILARELGLEGFGLYTLLWSAVLLLASAHTSFITMPIMSIGTQLKNLSNKSYFDVVLLQQSILSIFLAIVLAVILWIASFFNVDIDGLLIFSVALYMTIYFFHEFLRKYLFSVKKVNQVLMLDFAIYGFSIALLFILTNNEKITITTSFIALSISTLLILIFYCIFKCQYDSPSIKYFWHKTNEVKEFGMPLFHSSITQFIAGHIFVYICAITIGISSAGEIGVARHLVGPLLLMLISLESFIPIKFAEKYEKKKGSLEIYVFNILLKYTPIVAITLICIIFVSDYVVLYVYGAEFEYAGFIAKWFLFFIVFQLTTKILSIYCRTISELWPIKSGGTYSLVSSLITSYPLIHYFGYSGAMISLLIQQILLLSPLAYVFFKNSNNLNIHPLQSSKEKE